MKELLKFVGLDLREEFTVREQSCSRINYKIQQRLNQGEKREC